jgi:Co/Zn/Cd efflux system component
VLIVSGIAALVMTGGAFILRGAGGDDADDRDEHDLSVAAILLDTVADATAAASVAAAGAIILATGGWYWLDPAVALTVALIVTYHVIALIRKVLIRLRPAAADTTGTLLRPDQGEPSCSAESGARASDSVLPGMARSDCRPTRLTKGLGRSREM